MTNNFQQYSEYYDVLYQSKDYQGEVDFVNEILSYHLKERGLLLDLGCGTGRHAAHFGELGWNVDGLDNSPQMVWIANQNSTKLNDETRARLNFFEGDVRHFQTGKKYDAVLSLFHVLSYQTTNEEVVSMFRNVAKHLKPGGMFVFDYWYGPSVLWHRPETRIARLSSKKMDVVRIAEPVLHPNQSVVDVNYEIHVRTVEDGTTNVIQEQHRMRYFFLNELKFLLAQAGLKELTSVEWKTSKEPSFDSWGVVTVASK